MFRRLVILIVCFAVLTSACSLTTTPAANVVPPLEATPTQEPTAAVAVQPAETPAVTPTVNIQATTDPRQYTAPDGSFTLMMPDGWTVQDRGAAYPDLLGPDENGIRPVISFQEEQSETAMDQYVATYKETFISQNTGFDAIQEATLSTAGGQTYLRWEFSNYLQGHILHYTVYFFGSGNQNLVITYIRRDDTGKNNDGPVDEAMKTVNFSR